MYEKLFGYMKEIEVKNDNFFFKNSLSNCILQIKQQTIKILSIGDNIK